MVFQADFGKTAEDYAKHRAGFPPQFIARLKPCGIGLAGQALLDVGTGTGTLARQFAMEGCRVTGVDPAQPMLAEAARLDAQAGVSVSYQVGHAEGLPAGGATQDVVTVGQAWHWFDRPAAAGEAMRVLRPGGALVICHFDWLPLPGNLVDMTEKLIQQYNPQWKMGGGTGMYPQWLTDARVAGFMALETFSFDQDVAYSIDAWCGRIRASAGVAASLSAQKVLEFDAAHRAMLEREYPDGRLPVPHRVWAVIARKPYA